MANADMVGSILALLVLDSEGKRLFTKYYNLTFKSKDEELDFEQEVFSKASTQSTDSEILTFDQYIIVPKAYPNFGIYIIGDVKDNELILGEVMDTLSTALELIFVEGVESSGITQFMNVFLLVVDELIESGIILTLNCEEVLADVGVKTPSALNQAFTSLITKLKAQVAKSSYI
eukprot:TRINITY_DN6366_c0_g1_i2.p1 TRINITY_DN6366_c0_g1~~TRINITY_DN6366_c0_g1_i2.p1  ORF type:complete len:175 (-),score=43.24 TRINITY_DN6366_c0_g1_i2:128-652(-)